MHLYKLLLKQGTRLSSSRIRTGVVVLVFYLQILIFCFHCCIEKCCRIVLLSLRLKRYSTSCAMLWKQKHSITKKGTNYLQIYLLYSDRYMYPQFLLIHDPELLPMPIAINNLIPATTCRLVADVTRPYVEMIGCQFSPLPRHITASLFYRRPSLTKYDDNMVLRGLRTVAWLLGESLILGDYHVSQINRWARPC